mmetsp:Transcript_2078/g.4760  ORF Transcript_2078/g.4760 Transcript_2078/m.4760 type:complete len:88 (-) Transcript_2078:824-1087(-)
MFPGEDLQDAQDTNLGYCGDRWWTKKSVEDQKLKLDLMYLVSLVPTVHLDRQSGSGDFRRFIVLHSCFLTETLLNAMHHILIFHKFC